MTSTETTVHDEFVAMLKEAGLEEMATKLNVMNDQGKITDLLDANAPVSRVISTGKSLQRSVSIDAIPDRNGREVDAVAGLVSQNLSSRVSSAKKRRVSATKNVEGDLASTSSSSTTSKKMETFNTLVNELSFPGSALQCSTIKVLRVVEKKKRTTYVEVAQEVLKEMKMTDMNSFQTRVVHRRVYDVINVLVALDAVKKEENDDISWVGLPSTKEELDCLHQERAELLKNIQKKSENLQELLLQTIALKTLIQKNKENPHLTPENQRINLPFIVVSTNRDTVIECELSDTQTDIFFNFNRPFEIHDDHEILKRMRLHNVEPDALRKLLPTNLLQFLPDAMRVSHDFNKNK